MTIDPPARYNVHSDTESGLVLRERLWPRAMIFLVCGASSLIMLAALNRDPSAGGTVTIVFACLVLTIMTYGAVQFMLVGRVEVIDALKVIEYRAWGYKYRKTPLILAFSSLSAIAILRVSSGRGPYIYEVRLWRRDDTPVLLDRSHGDHVEEIAIAVAKHTGLPVDSYVVP